MNASHRLLPGRVLSLCGRRPRRICCVSGQLWLSLAGQDWLLTAGDVWLQPSVASERLLVEALGGDACVQWHEPAAALSCLARWRLRTGRAA